MKPGSEVGGLLVKPYSLKLYPCTSVCQFPNQAYQYAYSNHSSSRRHPTLDSDPAMQQGKAIPTLRCGRGRLYQSQKSFQTAAICSKTKVIVQETVHHIQENNVSWLGLDANRLPGFVRALLAKPALRIFNKGLFSNFA